MSQQSKPNKQPSYDVIKALDEKTYIVRRVKDGEQFIGHEWEYDAFDVNDLDGHLKRGAEAPVWALLNHKNLMSIVETVDNVAFTGSGDHPERLLLWDFADAGTLAAIFEEPPVFARQTGFLPESLCWHVVVSMLKALAWLHEGYREEYHIQPNDDDTVWEQKQWVMDSDWMPILHRNITPANIFFQHPKGSETCGFCKLGNLGKAFVSGHVNDKSGGPVVSIQSGHVRMEEMRKTIAVEDIYTVPKSERPYTKGTELWKLGSILHRMMTGVVAPPYEECNLCGCRHMDEEAPLCPHTDCHQDPHWENLRARLKDYTAGLKEMLFLLLSEHRDGGSYRSAITTLRTAISSYEFWKSETPDGRLYVDWDDDMDKRWTNNINRRKAAAAKDEVVGKV